MNAMDKTHLVLAKVLDQALKHGVSHWSLDFKSLELDHSFENYFFPCIEWLEAEGLIRVKSYSRTLGGFATGTADNINLTAKGMAILGHSIEIEGKSVTISDTVQRVSACKVDYNRIGDAIGGLVGGFTKCIGS